MNELENRMDKLKDLVRKKKEYALKLQENKYDAADNEEAQINFFQGHALEEFIDEIEEIIYKVNKK